MAEKYIMADNKCPVCGNNDGFTVDVSGPVEVLTSTEIGRVTLISCSKCGCAYASNWDRRRYKRLQKEREANG